MDRGSGGRVILDLGGALVALEALETLETQDEPEGLKTLKTYAPLSAVEWRFLQTLPRRPAVGACKADFRLAVVPEPLSQQKEPQVSQPDPLSLPQPLRPQPLPPAGLPPLETLADSGPADVHFGQSGIRVRHARYCAELDLAARRGFLYRRDDGARALRIVLRIAMTAVLPFAGGLPIHGAGMVAGGRSLVFFGRSEAGKTTLSHASPWPVVSDEMVAIAGDPPSLRATGYLRWPGAEPILPAPLAALVELAKGPETVIERLARPEGLRRLMHALWVPPVPLLQREALVVAARVVAAVPVYRMAWNPARPPFREIEEQVLGA